MFLCISLLNWHACDDGGIICKGYYPATSGKVIINGRDITAPHRGSVKSSMGFCPQEDTLFEDLTVEEHLQLFAEVRLN